MFINLKKENQVNIFHFFFCSLSIQFNHISGIYSQHLAFLARHMKGIHKKVNDPGWETMFCKITKEYYVHVLWDRLWTISIWSYVCPRHLIDSIVERIDWNLHRKAYIFFIKKLNFLGLIIFCFSSFRLVMKGHCCFECP